MDQDECKAYQLALCWLENSQKLFPKYNHLKLPKKGDPRKCLLFKYCYKLATETKGLIIDTDYELYIKAQLHILKAITLDDNTHPRIEPQILVGEKAWRRWKLWKKRYDSRLGQVHNQSIETQLVKVKLALESTKVFLVKIFSGTPSLEKYKEAVDNRNLFRWINLGKISPYYLALSPYISALFSEGIGKEVAVDLEVYRKSVDGEMFRDCFKELFPEEV